MRLVFAGTPDFARTALDALIAAGHRIVLVLTQPDRPAGRGLQIHPGPVKARALHEGIEVLQPRGLRLSGRYEDDAQLAHRRLRETPHDAMVVAAYGLILPQTILDMPPRGCINIHASLLPRWRGAAPIQRAIEAGDAETGITIMQMEAGLDTGPMLLVKKCSITRSDTTAALTRRLAGLGGDAIVEALASLERGQLESRPQHDPGDESAVRHAAKVSKDEGALDFTLSTRSLVDRIRAFDPWPGCTAQLVDEQNKPLTQFKVWRAEELHARDVAEWNGQTQASAVPGSVLGFVESKSATSAALRDHGVAIIVKTGDGAIALKELQKAGGKRLPANAFVRDFVEEGGDVRMLPRVLPRLLPRLLHFAPRDAGTSTAN